MYITDSDTAKFVRRQAKSLLRQAKHMRHIKEYALADRLEREAKYIVRQLRTK